MGVGYSPPAENLYCTVAHPRSWGHGGAGFPGFDRPLSIDFVRQFALAVSRASTERGAYPIAWCFDATGIEAQGPGAYMRTGEWGLSSGLHYCMYFAVYPTRTLGEAGGQQRLSFSERLRRSCSWKGAQRDRGSGTEVPRITATRGPGT